MRLWNWILILILITGVLVGCGGDAASDVEEQGSSDLGLEKGADTASYTSTVLDASYEGSLPANSQLALGTLRLEHTENIIAPDQARTLLPLWQAIQGGSLQSDAETNAVLKQIEAAMTGEQLAAVAAMQLTFEDMQAWMQENGVDMGPPPVAEGGHNPLGDMSEEDRSAMRATAQARGGLPGGGGQFGDMNEEQRSAMRATAEASGMALEGGRGPANASNGQLTMLAAQVVELLSARAAE